MRLHCFVISALLLSALLLTACGETDNPTAPLLDAGAADQLTSSPDASGTDAAPDGAQGVCPTGATFDVTLRKVLLTATVDGQGPFKLIYDTGAPDTVLSSKITGGKTGAQHLVKEIDLGGGFKLGPVNAYTYPMPAYMDGIIGNDAIGKRVVSIDYVRRQLWVSDTLREADLLACAHLQGKPEHAPITLAPYPFVAGEVDGVKGSLLVDTGASLGGVEQSVLKTTGKGNPQVEGYKMSISLGTFWSGYAMVGQMSVGKQSVKRITMYTMPDKTLPPPKAGATLATLPYGFMQHFLVTLDYTTMQLRLDAGKAAKLKDDYTLWGYGLSLSTNAAGAVTVTRVVAGSPAAISGVAEGDTLTSVDGADPAKISPEARIGLVLTSAPGVARSFKVERAGVSSVHDLTSGDLFAAFAP
jgi:hypothetical protein